MIAVWSGLAIYIYYLTRSSQEEKCSAEPMRNLQAKTCLLQLPATWLCLRSIFLVPLHDLDDKKLKALFI